MCDIQTIVKVAHCLGVPTGKLSCNNEKAITRTVLNLENIEETVTGFTTILNVLAKESRTEIALNSTQSAEIIAQVHQWIQYAVFPIAAASKDKHLASIVLREMNTVLATKSYLVEQQLTLADLVVFHAIYNLMQKLSPLEKETYLNLSRWFDHLQQKPEVLQDANSLNFTTIYLHGWATGTHL